MELIGLVAIALIIVCGLVLLTRPQQGTRASNALPSRSPQRSLAEIEAEVRQLVSQGHKIEAIKRVRRVSDLSLTAAKAYVAALADGAAPSGRSAPLDPKLVAEVQQLLAQGQHLEAIKHLRTHSQMSLAAAKTYVDSLRSGNL
ncbi:hypothetical protein GS597_05865 [Synechococcales cyanobacterium C]|uniref:Ribosomal protein L7/L12 C-terminal domain-containing protein n=1 Tax=Petrachloros mirabilis ULC683 TaxID=2781853 RepID=A0A8K1ZY88_9CYAN|nr:hypothetical protein [Petrachloros mirabilis]NCJ06047.1 hypothetical protein [Petrachloros mirabilis ULC683]